MIKNETGIELKLNSLRHFQTIQTLFFKLFKHLRDRIQLPPDKLSAMETFPLMMMTKFP